MGEGVGAVRVPRDKPSDVIYAALTGVHLAAQLLGQRASVLLCQKSTGPTGE